jgi:hypothetical protein
VPAGAFSSMPTRLYLLARPVRLHTHLRPLVQVRARAQSPPRGRLPVQERLRPCSRRETNHPFILVAIVWPGCSRGMQGVSSPASLFFPCLIP